MSTTSASSSPSPAAHSRAPRRSARTGTRHAGSPAPARRLRAGAAPRHRPSSSSSTKRTGRPQTTFSISSPSAASARALQLADEDAQDLGERQRVALDPRRVAEQRSAEHALERAHQPPVGAGDIFAHRLPAEMDAVILEREEDHRGDGRACRPRAAAVAARALPPAAARVELDVPKSMPQWVRAIMSSRSIAKAAQEAGGGARDIGGMCVAVERAMAAPDRHLPRMHSIIAIVASTHLRSFAM